MDSFGSPGRSSFATPWRNVSAKKMQGMSDDECQEWWDLCEAVEAGRLPKWTEFAFWELKGTVLRSMVCGASKITLKLANNFFLSALFAVPCVHATTLATEKQAEKERKLIERTKVCCTHPLNHRLG
jgi:hypothetical protein